MKIRHRGSNRALPLLSAFPRARQPFLRRFPKSYISGSASMSIIKLLWDMYLANYANDHPPFYFYVRSISVTSPHFFAILSTSSRNLNKLLAFIRTYRDSTLISRFGHIFAILVSWSKLDAFAMSKDVALIAGYSANSRDKGSEFVFPHTLPVASKTILTSL